MCFDRSLYTTMSNSNVRLFFSTAFLAVISSVTVSAAVIFANPITGTNPNTSNPYTTGQTFDTNVTVGGIARGSGIVSANANNRYNASGWNSASFDSSDYFEFTITPKPSFEIDFTNFVYTGQASGSGATSFAFRSSVDSFASNLGTPTAGGTTISLSAISFQNVTSATTFRLYGWAASAAGGTFSVNDFTFNGSVSAIPEPSTFAAVLGAAALAGVAARRRRSV